MLDTIATGPRGHEPLALVVRVEHGVPVPPRTLGLLEHRAREDERPGPVPPRLLDRRDTDARRHPGKDVRVVPEPLAHRLDEVRSDRGRGLPVGVGEHDGELVASGASDDVGRPHGLPEQCGALDQHLVSRGVAQQVVDRRDVIEVDEQERPAAAVGSGVASLESLEFPLDAAAVDQAREWVMVGMVRDELPELSALGLVDRGDEHGWCRVLVRRRAQGESDVPEPTVVTFEAVVDVHRGAGRGEGRPDGLVEAGSGAELVQSAPGQVTGGDTQELGEGAVRPQDLALPVYGRDSLRRQLDQVVRLLAGLPHLLPRRRHHEGEQDTQDDEDPDSRGLRVRRGERPRIDPRGQRRGRDRDDDAVHGRRSDRQPRGAPQERQQHQVAHRQVSDRAEDQGEYDDGDGDHGYRFPERRPLPRPPHG